LIFLKLLGAVYLLREFYLLNYFSREKGGEGRGVRSEE